MPQKRKNTRYTPRRPTVHKVVADMIRARQEVKRSNTTAGNTAWTPSGVVLPVTQLIPQGDLIAARSGDTIRPISLKLNLTIVSNTTPYLGRVIIFQDMLNVGIDPTVAQVLDGSSYLSTYLADTAQQRRFKILYDHVYQTNTTATIVTDTTKIFRELNFKLKGKIFYNGTINATASNGPGAIYMLFISDVASGLGGYYNYYTTVTYTDS